jgi:hypothetical protein
MDRPDDVDPHLHGFSVASGVVARLAPVLYMYFTDAIFGIWQHL